MAAVQLSGSSQSQLLEYFPGAGMYEWQNGTGWNKDDSTSALPTNAQQAMFATGNFQGGAVVDASVTFPGQGGIWLDPPGASSDTSGSQNTGSNSGPVSVLGIDPASPAATAPITVANGATVDLTTPSDAAVTFAGSSGTLQLDQSASFTGTITGFGGQDQIDLTDIGYTANTTLGYAANNGNSGGALTVGNGINTANIALLGNYMAASFVTSSDGHGGTLVSEAAQMSAQTSPLAQPHAAV